MACMHEDDRVQIAGCHLDLEEEDDKVEECERKVGSHDVPQPVSAGMRGGDTGHIEGVGQGIVIRQTLTTQCSHFYSIHAYSAVIIQNTARLNRIVTRMILKSTPS